MTLTLSGIVRGNAIEVEEGIGLSDGQAVEIILTPTDNFRTEFDPVIPTKRPKPHPGPPPGWRPTEQSPTAGCMADSWTAEDDRILEEIYRDRQLASFREVPE